MDRPTEHNHGRIVPIPIEDEMKRSYIDYAMSVIVSRALPDVRDGLKPVHRRILYAMREEGMTSDKPYKKSARAVGQVIAKYHPHGEAAVYDAIVRMAQDFAIRYQLVDGHGNFGSLDGDPPAAMRYTEIRLAALAGELLRDIDKDTVDFIPNFDESEKEPVILPARFPNLLVNGSAGIAVGMATNIPPHNLGEVIDALLVMIDEPDVDMAGLTSIIKGPDFPTGAYILGREGIRQAYSTGRGIITIRAKAQIEVTAGGKMRILITEVPYQVNKATLIERIAELVREKKLDGVTDLRDESDRHGVRVVIELRRDVNANVVLNRLYKYTQMQQTFGIILLALVEGRPKVLNLRQILVHYLDYQKVVIIRRTKFELARAEARAHILEGLRIALDNLDAVIKLIRASKDADEARTGLMSRFGLSEKQAQAILDMRLQRLTALERDKIESEYLELAELIEYLRAVLASERMVLKIIRRELVEVKEKFAADGRRTQIISGDGTEDFEVEDLIADEDIVITMTRQGYVKRLPAVTYRSQKRGGRGVAGMGTKDEDFVEQLFITTTHHYLLFFSNRGRVYRIKAHRVPEASRTAKGTAVVNLVPLERGETITTVIPVRDFDPGAYLFMATRRGIVKRTELTDYDTSRHAGVIALALDDGDELIGVRLCGSEDEVILATRQGQSIRFPITEVRGMGRPARGVKGITLAPGDVVESMDVVREGCDVLAVTTGGAGKRTPVSDYPTQGRGGKGVINMRLTQKTGEVVGIRLVTPGDEIMVVSGKGIIIRLPVDGIRITGRSTQGVSVMRPDEGDHVVSFARVVAKDDD